MSAIVVRDTATSTSMTDRPLREYTQERAKGDLSRAENAF